MHLFLLLVLGIVLSVTAEDTTLEEINEDQVEAQEINEL